MTVKLKVYPDQRPRTRDECADMPRPCPFLSCRYHLAHDWVKPWHGPKPTDDEIVERIENSDHSCVLDVADRGGLAERDVAEVMQASHARIHQLAKGAYPKVKKVLSKGSPA